MSELLFQNVMKLTKSCLPLFLCAAALLPVGLPAIAEVIPSNSPAPELVGGPWLNTPGDRPITLESRKGKVTIVEFWTYRCINCIHNLPSYARWAQQLSSQDVAVIGVHTPETASERSPAGVKAQVKKFGIVYPVLLDEKRENWTRWNQQFWPTVYLVDKKGQIRYRWEGELGYHGDKGEAEMAQLVQKLLAE